MELYNVPRHTYVRILTQLNVDDPDAKRKVSDAAKYTFTLDLSTDVKVPIDAPNTVSGELIYFDHIDGAYSLCYKVDEETMELGEICHIAAWTQVEIYDDLKDEHFVRIREIIGRAGYGKDGLGEYRKAALKDMSDAWVRASIDFVESNHVHRKYYIKELEYRSDNNIVIEDAEI